MDEKFGFGRIIGYCFNNGIWTPKPPNCDVNLVAELINI